MAGGPQGLRLVFCVSGHASVRAPAREPVGLDRWDLVAADGTDGPLRIEGEALVLIARVPGAAPAARAQRGR